MSATDPAGERSHQATKENTFIYIRGYPSKEERDKRLAAHPEDPEFQDVARKVVAKTHNI
jgi:hypothetical protein